MNIEITDVQKDLMKNKTMAEFDRYENGNIYYNVILLGSPYQFPVSTIKEVHINHSILDENGDDTGMKFIAKIHAPQADVKGAAFTKSMRGSELFRWIKKAYNNNDLIPLGIV